MDEVADPGVTSDSSKIRRLRMPAAAGALLLVVGIGIGTRMASDSGSTGAGSEATASTAVPAATTATTARPTTTTEVPKPVVTTQFVATPEQQNGIAVRQFNEVRSNMAKAIESDHPDVRTVDLLTLDVESDGTGAAEGAFLVLSVTSDYRSDQMVEDIAWTLTRTMADVYGVWEEQTPAFQPKFALTVNSLRMVCPHDLMRRMSNRLADRSEWLTACERR